MAKLGVLIIHGIGNPQPDYADTFIKKVTAELTEDGKFAKADIVWEAVYWSDVLATKENQYFESLKNAGSVDYLSLRKFIITYLADAVSYHSGNNSYNAYNAIHNKVKEGIIRLCKKLKNPDAPLVMLGHSLGSVILSNYIWDGQSRRQASVVRRQGELGEDTLNQSEGRFYSGQGRHKASGVRRQRDLKSLTGIITFGSNIPLFAFAHDPIEAITFPDPDLPENLKKMASWVNIYDPDDVLGYPLKLLSPSYAKAVTEDVKMEIGNLLLSWTPLIHSYYWSDKKFIKYVGEYLGRRLVG